MAQATNSTYGEIKLAGDLAGNNNALAPELTATGVTAGNYKLPIINIDIKGRVISAVEATWTDLMPLVSDATTSTTGKVMIGDNIDVNAGVISVPTATSSTLGLVKVGTGLSISAGVLNFDAGNATSSTAGIVQIGTGIDVVNGLISIPDATDTIKGKVQIGTGIDVASGVISIAESSNSVKGVVQIGDNISINSGTISIPNASDLVKGVVQVGTNIDVASGVISVPVASDLVKGVVQIGDGLTAVAGTVSANDASTGSKGVVRVGSNIDVASGVISVADATTGTKGIVQVGTNIDVINGVISVADASGSTKGVVQIGSGIEVTDGVISVPTATNTTIGLVTAGTGIDIDVTGTITTNVAGIPDASDTVKGIVQIGSGLSVTNGVVSNLTPDATDTVKGVVQIGSGIEVTDGVISVPTATNTTLGVVKVDNTILTNTAGVISAPYASTSEYGVVKIGSGIDVIDGVISVPTTVPTASGSTIGGVKITSLSNNTGLMMVDDVLTGKYATSEQHGVVYLADPTSSYISVDSNGKLQANHSLAIAFSGGITYPNSGTSIAITLDASLWHDTSGLSKTYFSIPASPISATTSSLTFTGFNTISGSAAFVTFYVLFYNGNGSSKTFKIPSGATGTTPYSVTLNGTTEKYLLVRYDVFRPVTGSIQCIVPAATTDNLWYF